MPYLNQDDPGEALERDRQHISRAVLELAKVRRDLANQILGGISDFEEASSGVQAILITRILHPDLAEVLVRPEEFFGPGLVGDQPDVPSGTAHAQVHVACLENSMEIEEAASALHYLLLVARRYNEDVADALHVALHVLGMIHTQQVWGASVAAHGETDHRRKEGAAALREASRWFANAWQGQVKKLPGPLRKTLLNAPDHPQG